MSNAVARFVVVGNPIAHSRSPEIHQAFAAQFGLQISYERALVPPGSFAEFATDFFAADGHGMNITVPFKGDACAIADHLDPAAEAAAAVNTLSIEGGNLVGYNTDGIGLIADLTTRHATPLAGANVLLLGAGGAARGVLGPLLEAQPKSIAIANRTPAKATALAQQFASRAQHLGVTLSATDLQHLPGASDVIISSMAAGHDGTDLDLAAGIAEGAFCYDMNYGATASFARWAAAHGAAGVADGLGMLVEQAAAAFSIWLDEQPHTDPVLASLRVNHG